MRSGTGFGGSDIDLGIYFADADVHLQSQRTMHERAQILATARARLADVFEVKEFIQYARVPVLKLWDPVRQVRALDALAWTVRQEHSLVRWSAAANAALGRLRRIGRRRPRAPQHRADQMLRPRRPARATAGVRRQVLGEAARDQRLGERDAEFLRYDGAFGVWADHLSKCTKVVP